MALTGRCHCGRNAFRVDAELPEKLTRCTCSLCSRRGHLYAYVTPEKFQATQAESDAVYRWNTKLVANHFCSACGCDLYVHSPAFEPDGKWDGVTPRIAVNARLLDDFEAADGAGSGDRRRAPLVKAPVSRCEAWRLPTSLPASGRLGLDTRR